MRWLALTWTGRAHGRHSDPRVRVFDANFGASGRRAGPGGAAAPGSELAGIRAQAEVLVDYPVPKGLAA
jgi:hypothetical protein